ncbi:Uncharacterized AAA domain-containing protein C31G5.19, partial [Aduncisulcus paluster]
MGTRRTRKTDNPEPQKRRYSRKPQRACAKKQFLSEDESENSAGVSSPRRSSRLQKKALVIDDSKSEYSIEESSESSESVEETDSSDKSETSEESQSNSSHKPSKPVPSREKSKKIASDKTKSRVSSHREDSISSNTKIISKTAAPRKPKQKDDDVEEMEDEEESGNNSPSSSPESGSISSSSSGSQSSSYSGYEQSSSSIQEPRMSARSERLARRNASMTERKRAGIISRHASKRDWSRQTRKYNQRISHTLSHVEDEESSSSRSGEEEESSSTSSSLPSIVESDSFSIFKDADVLYRQALKKSEQKKKKSHSKNGNYANSFYRPGEEKEGASFQMLDPSFMKKDSIRTHSTNSVSSSNRNGASSSIKRGDVVNSDSSPITLPSNLSLDMVGGLAEQVRQVKEVVFLPLVHKHVFKSVSSNPPRGVLFHGPPGCGKTLVCRVLASMCSDFLGKKVTFFMRKGADCMSKWVGEAEKQLRSLFNEAKAMSPSIIFFDEIDGLCPVRSSRQDQIHSSVVATLLSLMDGMDDRGDVVVIGATNRPDSIDPALRRPGRFDKEVLFTLPNVTGREEILKIHTQKWTHPISHGIIKRIAEKTEGYSGADLAALCNEAALFCIRRTKPELYVVDKTPKKRTKKNKISVPIGSEAQSMIADKSKQQPNASKCHSLHLQEEDHYKQEELDGSKDSLMLKNNPQTEEIGLDVVLQPQEIDFKCAMKKMIPSSLRQGSQQIDRRNVLYELFPYSDNILLDIPLSKKMPFFVDHLYKYADSIVKNIQDLLPSSSSNPLTEFGVTIDSNSFAPQVLFLDTGCSSSSSSSSSSSFLMSFLLPHLSFLLLSHGYDVLQLVNYSPNLHRDINRYKQHIGSKMLVVIVSDAVIASFIPNMEHLLHRILSGVLFLVSEKPLLYGQKTLLEYGTASLSLDSGSIDEIIISMCSMLLEYIAEEYGVWSVGQGVKIEEMKAKERRMRQKERDKKRAEQRETEEFQKQQGGDSNPLFSISTIGNSNTNNPKQTHGSVSPLLSSSSCKAISGDTTIPSHSASSLISGSSESGILPSNTQTSSSSGSVLSSSRLSVGIIKLNMTSQIPVSQPSMSDKHCGSDISALRMKTKNSDSTSKDNNTEQESESKLKGNIDNPNVHSIDSKEIDSAIEDDIHYFETHPFLRESPLLIDIPLSHSSSLYGASFSHLHGFRRMRSI